MNVVRNAVERIYSPTAPRPLSDWDVAFSERHAETLKLLHENQERVRAMHKMRKARVFMTDEMTTQFVADMTKNGELWVKLAADERSSGVPPPQ